MASPVRYASIAPEWHDQGVDAPSLRTKRLVLLPLGSADLDEADASGKRARAYAAAAAALGVAALGALAIAARRAK